jgi:hypothetical protein
MEMTHPDWRDTVPESPTDVIAELTAERNRRAASMGAASLRSLHRPVMPASYEARPDLEPAPDDDAWCSADIEAMGALLWLIVGIVFAALLIWGAINVIDLWQWKP